MYLGSSDWLSLGLYIYTQCRVYIYNLTLKALFTLINRSPKRVISEKSARFFLSICPQKHPVAEIPKWITQVQCSRLALKTEPGPKRTQRKSSTDCCISVILIIPVTFHMHGTVSLSTDLPMSRNSPTSPWRLMAMRMLRTVMPSQKQATTLALGKWPLSLSSSRSKLCSPALLQILPET